MIIPSSVTDSIAAAGIDISGDWLSASTPVWSADYSALLPQPVSIAVTPLADMRFLSVTKVTLTIRISSAPTSLVSWSGIATLVADGATGGPTTFPLHNSLTGRDAEDAHPMSSITGLVETFAKLGGTIIEVANYAALPAVGSSSVTYVTLDDGKLYRWGGTTYVEISASLVLGETSTTAYRGDLGKTAFDHSQETAGNPHGTTAEMVGAATTSHAASHYDDDALDGQSIPGLLPTDLPAWAGVGIDGAATANRGLRFRTSGSPRYNIILGPDTDAVPLLYHMLYSLAGVQLDSWASVVRATGGNVYLGGSYSSPRAIVLAGALRQGAAETIRISATGKGQFSALSVLGLTNNRLLKMVSSELTATGVSESAGVLTATAFVKDGGTNQQVSLADGTTKPLSEFDLVDPNSLGPVQILDGSLTFATNFPTAVLFGAAANFPANFWKVGKVVETEGFVLSATTTNVSIHFFGGGAEQYIQAINLSPSNGTNARYRSVLTCASVSGGNATIKHTFSYGQSGASGNGGSAVFLSPAIPINQASGFYLKASGAIGSAEHAGAFTRMWS